MVSLPGNGKKWFIQPLFKMQLLKPSALLKPWPRQSVQLFTPIPTRSEIPGQTTTATPQIVCGCLMWHPCFAYQKIQMKHHLHLHIRNLIISHESTGLPLVYPHYFWGVQHVSTCFCWCTQQKQVSPRLGLSENVRRPQRLWAGHHTCDGAKTWGRLPYYHGFAMVLPWFHHGFSMVLPMISCDLISSLVFCWAMVDLCLDESSHFARFMTSSRQLPSANRAMRGHSACHHPGPPDAKRSPCFIPSCRPGFLSKLPYKSTEYTARWSYCKYQSLWTSRFQT